MPPAPPGAKEDDDVDDEEVDADGVVVWVLWTSWLCGTPVMLLRSSIGWATPAGQMIGVRYGIENASGSTLYGLVSVTVTLFALASAVMLFTAPGPVRYCR